MVSLSGLLQYSMFQEEIGSLSPRATQVPLLLVFNTQPELIKAVLGLRFLPPSIITYLTSEKFHVVKYFLLFYHRMEKRPV